MPKERYKEGGNVQFRAIYSSSEINIMQEVGIDYDVGVRVLQREGQSYTHRSVDPLTNREVVHTGIVPEGKVYAEVFSIRPDITNYWKAVNSRR